MRRLLWIIVVMVLLGTPNCSWAEDGSKQAEATPVESVMPKVNDPRLAQLILKPERKVLDVSRDPFKPLLSPEGQAVLLADEQGQTMTNVKFIGVAHVDHQYMALLQTQKGRKVFRRDDKIDNFTIQDIQKDLLVLDNGVEKITLKRGASSEN